MRAQDKLRANVPPSVAPDEAPLLSDARPLGWPRQKERLGAAGERTLELVAQALVPGEHKTTAAFGGLTLDTAFQPVLSLAHGRVVGHEALLRAYDASGAYVSPLEVFARSREAGQAALLDTLCRALHLANFSQQAVGTGHGRGWVFFNFNASAILEDELAAPLFSRLLEGSAMPPHQVVVEILESKTYDEDSLAEVVGRFREMGCVVALDDFGAGQSNFERIWRIAPDVVKLDRSMLTEAMRATRVRRILPGLVSLLHEAGCLVVMEGIEDEEQALLAMEMDADFVQGYYFARPADRIGELDRSGSMMRDLFQRFRERVTRQTALARDSLTRYTRALESCSIDLERGMPLELACADLLAHEGVDRCYLLNSDGVQVGVSVQTAERRNLTDPRYLPFADCEGANWSLRPHFRRAVTRPSIVQVSQPYLSVTDARSCMTLSVGFYGRDGLQVLCADLDLESGQALATSPSWRPPMGTWNDLK